MGQKAQQSWVVIGTGQGDQVVALVSVKALEEEMNPVAVVAFD